MLPRTAFCAALLVALCSATATELGQMAPDFARDDLSGHLVRLADYRGKWVLLNFWASWCGPCLEEMPRFSVWQRAYGGEGLQIIGVSMDDDVKPVKRLMVRTPAAYPIVLGDAALGKTFGGVLGLPLTYLIDPDGRIVERFQGVSDLARMEARITHHLAEQKH